MVDIAVLNSTFLHMPNQEKKPTLQQYDINSIAQIFFPHIV